MPKAEYVVGQRIRLTTFLNGPNLPSGAEGIAIEVSSRDVVVRFSDIAQARLPFDCIEPVP
jgi:hypothetical protein